DEQEQKLPEFTIVFAGTQALYASRLTPANALAVLATAVYLGVESLCAQCTAYIIRTLSASRVLDYVRLSRRHSYHPWSSRIADACHTFLCRNGFDDPRVQCLGVFERLPAEWLVRVIGSDAFWVPSEWDRYLFCRRIVERRRRMRQHRRETVRCNEGGRRGTGEWDLHGCLEQHNGAGDEDYDDDPEEEEEEEEEGGEDEEAVYERLFSTSIVYMHMTLEQLQLILNDHDPWTGRPFTLSHVVHESFWWQTEFRTLIEGADRKNAVLGLTTAARVVPQNDAMGGRLRASDPVPDKDVNAVDPVILPFNDPKRLLDESETSVPSQLYSTCSPFRFSVQFENVAQLDGGVQMSSDNFYYAGSLWNVYVKKVPHRESGFRLVIHLHRLSPASPSPTTNRLRRPVFGPFPRGRGTPPRPRQLPSPPSTPPKDSHCGGESDDETTDFDRDEELFQVDELCDLAKDTVPIEESFSCFADRRESTRTWFRVYATSVGPLHQVTHFQAAPDDFRLSHSWGWIAPELYTACYLPELSQPPLDFETACRGRGHCDQRTRTRTRTQPGPTLGHRSPVHDMDDEGEEETCDCEASAKYGPHHHHRPPVKLKLSFVMGHI
ncbi:hypothetical protein BG006_002344, partial [Podila minutissima]